jgi:uncharacterized protein
VSKLVFKSAIDAPASLLFAWHERPGALQRLIPPWAPVSIEQFEGIRDGQRAVLRMGYGLASIRWVAEHRDYIAGRQFRDVQVKGPMRRWEHLHLMEADDAMTSTLSDIIEYTPRLVSPRIRHIRHELERQFAYRHRITRADVAAHHRFARSPMRIAISGSSGLIGEALASFLTGGGHRVQRLVRRPAEHADEIEWKPRDGRIEKEALEGVDAVIHLGGAPILSLWTEENKMRIYGSRVHSTRLLAETLARLDNPPSVLINASAMGYYGDRGSEILTEDSSAGNVGFLPALVRDWEAATGPAADAGIRTVMLRTGNVLSPAGGMLGLMQTPFKMGVGGRVGFKDQYMSWIAIDDVLHAVYHALNTDTVSGPINLTAPEPVNAEELSNTLAGVLNRPSFFNVPSALVKAIGRDLATEAILASLRVLPERLLESGYQFLYPNLEGALRHMFGR